MVYAIRNTMLANGKKYGSEKNATGDGGEVSFRILPRSTTMKMLTAGAKAAMNKHVDMVFNECMGDEDVWPLGQAWRSVRCEESAAHIAAAIIYEHDCGADAEWMVAGERRGRSAPGALCVVADCLGV